MDSKAAIKKTINRKLITMLLLSTGLYVLLSLSLIGQDAAGRSMGLGLGVIAICFFVILPLSINLRMYISKNKDVVHDFSSGYRLIMNTPLFVAGIILVPFLLLALSEFLYVHF